MEFTQDQASADSLVVEANNAVDTVVKADAARGLPGAAMIVALPSGATTSGSQACTSGNYSYTLTYNEANGQPISYVFSYNNCVFGAGANSVTYNGTMNWRYDRFTSASNYQVTYTYNITYTYTGSLAPYSGSLNSSATCTFNGTANSCTYNVNGSRVDSSINVSTSGTVTTVRSATVRLNGTSAAGEVVVVFDNWVYDSATGRATSGTVTVTDSRGNRAVVTATGTGYTVQITYNGSTSNYTVTF